MTRICHLSVVHRHTDPRIFERECRTLADAGHDVTFMVPGPVPSDLVDGVHLAALPPRSRATRWMNTYDVLQKLHHLKPQVVHVHDPELLLLMPLLRPLVPRLVYDMHEYVPQQVAAKHYIPARVRPAAARTVDVLQRTLARFTDGVVGVTNEQFEALAARPALRLALPNYPRSSRFVDAQPLPELAADPRLKLIYIGGLTPNRGTTMMLDVMAQCDDAVLYLGGIFGDPAYEAVVRDRIDKELSDRVKLFGRIAPADVPAYLTSADVVWVPAMVTSQYGKPTVTTKLFEGMAVGLAALVSDLPGRGDVVTASACGVAVAPTVAGHVAGLRSLAGDRAAVKAMGARSRAAVLERYSWEKVEKSLVDFYTELCSGLPDEEKRST